MESGERTRDIYEQIEGYPKPPLIPLPDPDDFSDMEGFGLRLTSLSRGIVRAAMKLSGFRSFQGRLPETLEAYLRTTNLRTPGLYSPVISATVALKDDARSLEPLERAMTLLLASYSFYEELMSARLQPDMYRDQVLEMGQYPNFFSTSLWIEGRTTRLFKSTKTTQITVIVNQRYYFLQLGEGWSKANYGQILEALKRIVEDSRQDAGQTRSPGILTAASDRTQFAAFKALRQQPDNAECLDAIRHSFLTLCLDLEDHPASDADAALITHSKNWGNRWHHSSFQLVVFGNAKACGICHFTAYLDGNIMIRGGAEIRNRAEGVDVTLPAIQLDESSPLTFSRLNWQIDDEILEAATKDVEAVLDDQQATFELEGIGREYYKRVGVSPVPAFIVALSMASKTFAGETIRIEQFLTMSKYRCMDLATAMVTTPEVVRFVEYMETNEIENRQARAYLDAAIDSQIVASRKARDHYSTMEALGLFLRSRTGLGRWYAIIILISTVLLLRLSGLLKPIRRQVAVSHPVVFPEVPILGRPGVRLPYAEYYGLHYQMFDDKTVITMMPGEKWRVSNTEFVALLQEKLDRVNQILESTSKPRSD